MIAETGASDSLWRPEAGMWGRNLGRRRKIRSQGPADDPAPAPPSTSATITDEDREKLALLLSLVTDKSQPNINALNEAVRNLDILALNVKSMGYRLGRSLAAAIPPPSGTSARSVGLASKISTQADLESDWAAHWLSELRLPLMYHRKYWEFAYVLQALHDAGRLQPGARGLGFGCGVEPLPSYLANRGVFVTMTDLPPEDSRAQGWTRNNEYAATLEHARAKHLVERDVFERQVDLLYLDMNSIPADLTDYDFCWSICALEHLGSIRHGLDFIRHSLRTLKPGGTAVHTLEYNIDPDGPTTDNWVTVLFQRRHLEAFADELRSEGHEVAPFDFHFGDGPMDHFIDLPPWHDITKGKLSDWIGPGCHLKLAVDGFVATCFGLIITKAI